MQIKFGKKDLTREKVFFYYRRFSKTSGHHS